MTTTRALFIFHRDLRLVDNKALALACSTCKVVYPVFILPDDQILRQKNPYFSDAAVQFMCESLESLDADIRRHSSRHSQHKQQARLTLLRGPSTTSVVRDIISNCQFIDTKITHVVFNADETPYAQARDAELAALCSSKGIACTGVHGDAHVIGLEDAMYHDATLQTTRPYTNFSQFYARFVPLLSTKSNDDVDVEFSTLPRFSAATKSTSVIDPKLGILYRPVPALVERGGRVSGLQALRRVNDNSHEYGKTRDVLALQTTHLSPHLRFGTISIREAHAAAMSCEALQRQLAFREFYRKPFATNVVGHRRAFRHDLDAKIPWRQPKDDPAAWDAWTQGRTGFPLVDAGIRELLRTGFMHNRARMVVASFATRYLLFDWRPCARFFYTHLCDADPISNTAGWQWAAGVGIDSPPPFRRPLNPFRQSARFDVDATYIKRHMQEVVSDIAPHDLHRWDDANVRSRYETTAQHVKYWPPIVDARAASDRALSIWKEKATTTRTKTPTTTTTKKKSIGVRHSASSSSSSTPVLLADMPARTLQKTLALGHACQT